MIEYQQRVLKMTGYLILGTGAVLIACLTAASNVPEHPQMLANYSIWIYFCLVIITSSASACILCLTGLFKKRLSYKAELYLILASIAFSFIQIGGHNLFFDDYRTFAQTFAFKSQIAEGLSTTSDNIGTLK